MAFVEFWTKIGFFLKNKKNYKYRLRIKIMFKLMYLGHVGIYIRNTIVIDYGIGKFFKLKVQLLTMTLT